MDDHMIQLLDKLHNFLEESQIEAPPRVSGCFDWLIHCFVSEDAWTLDKKTLMRGIKFVKSFLFYYYAESSGVDEAKDFTSLFEYTRKYFWWLYSEIPEVFESDNPGDILYAISRCFGTINLLCTNIGKIYDKLLKLSHSAPFVNSIMFDQFADSVQQYVMNVPKKPCGWGRSAHNYIEFEANYKDTVHKLEGFRYVVSSFCKQCTDKKKSRSLLARSAALVFSILHVASANNVVKLNTREMEVNIFRSSSAMSRMLSLHNPDAVEVYLEVVSANVETIKASKPSSEGSVYSFLNLLQLAKTRVHILGGILDLPILDLIDDGPDEQVKTFLKRGYAVASREAGSLSSSIPPNCVVLSNMIQKLNLIKGELFVQEVHNHKAKLSSFTVNRAANIREALKFLHRFFKMPAVCMGDKDKLLLQLIEAFLREAGSLCDSRGTKEFEAMIMESSIAIYTLSKAEAILELEVLADSTLSLNFLAEFRIEMFHKNLTFSRASLLGEPDDATVSTITNQTMQKSQLMFHKNTCLKSDGVPEVHMRGLWLPFHNFPKSDGVVFAQHLLGKLKKLLSEKVGTVTFMKDETEALLGELEFLTSFLKDVKREDSKNKGIGFRVTSLMYQAECIFDMFILGVGDVPLWYHQLVLYASIQEAKFIKTRILQHCPRESFGSPLQDVPRALAHGTTRFDDSKQISEEVIVGFDDQAETIVDQLRYGSNHLQVVTLVGMAGIGKTTLAEKVYSNDSIQYHFGFRALCSVSQIYKKRELLVSILGDSTADMGKQDDNDLALKVKQMLKGKRYLIVVDDVWSIEHWDDLKLSFPDDMKGSRILMTTCDRGVARKASPGRESHVLQLLSPSQSWDILQAKLFQGQKCPGPLWRVGSLIAEHCRGLPLAIVVVAGILKRTGMEKGKWEEIAEHLRSLVADDQERQFTDILEFSYNHLPSYLKPCYLYLGSFLEDQEIQAKKLQWLWMGEGFIPKIVSKSLEETAEGYLVELINRSLVMEVNISSWGCTKTCRVHDMLRDLCIKRAKEDNFMQLFTMNDSLKPDSPVGKQYRLCVHSPKQNFIQLRPSASHVHSLLFFATDNSQDNNSYDISTIFQDFKLVRVLDLEPITASVFPSGTDLLICLNYLAIKGNIKSVPSCIANLWNLETLLVKGTKGEIALPSTLWSMASLRHVHIRPSASLTIASPELENGIDLENLTTFSSPAFSNSKLAEKLMKRWVRLRKLRCIFLEHWDNNRLFNIFPALEFLTELESLNIYNGGRSLPYEMNFPMNLKKLTLSRFSLPWDDISLISKLKNLVVLKLLFKAFEGDVWVMEEEIFPKLKVLVLGNLNLAVWNNLMDCSDHFPELEKLVLRSCKKLVEVPSNFGEASTLQMIEVKWCCKSTVKSVEKILEQQLELGNQDFQVMITPPEWDFRR